jgi:hypothetical protein
MNNETYFDDQQVSEILAAFKYKPDLDLSRLRRSLEHCAWLYKEAKSELARVARPKDRVLILRGLCDKASRLSDALHEALRDPYLNRMLDNTTLAPRRGIAFTPEGQGAEVAIERRLVDRVIGQLAELERFLKSVEQQAKPGSGGNRPDIALYELILTIEEFYLGAAANPHLPTGWSPNSENNEFLRFTQAILKPLGIKKTDDALRELYRRAHATGWRVITAENYFPLRP